MDIGAYRNLPAEEQVKFQSHRMCDCGEHLVRTGHSTGDLHTVCPKCDLCPDCEEGDV